jgi:hypothetical protein
MAFPYFFLKSLLLKNWIEGYACIQSCQCKKLQQPVWNRALGNAAAYIANNLA